MGSSSSAGSLATTAKCAESLRCSLICSKTSRTAELKIWATFQAFASERLIMIIIFINLSPCATRAAATDGVTRVTRRLMGEDPPPMPLDRVSIGRMSDRGRIGR